MDALHSDGLSGKSAKVSGLTATVPDAVPSGT